MAEAFGPRRQLARLWLHPVCSVDARTQGKGAMLIRPANPVVARLLVVTARTDLARYAYLRLVMDSTIVGVVLDRRMGERRWRQKRVAAERRRLDRRQLDLTEDLRRSGWAMVSRSWRSGCSCSWLEASRYRC